MKKVRSFSVIVAVPLLLTSCHYSYDCTCHFKTPSGNDSSYFDNNIHKSQSGAIDEVYTFLLLKI
jgi:hypothetical protein